MTNELPLSRQLVLSCFSAGVAEAVTLPIDTIKVHLQTQSYVKGVKDSVRLILQHDGKMGFVNASIPSVLRQVSYSGVRLGLYAWAKDRPELISVNSTFFGKIVVAGGCGLVSSIIASPLDVIKTRIQANQGVPKAFSDGRPGWKSCFNNIYQHEGIKGFYRGIWQTGQRSCLISSIQMPCYFGLQETLDKITWFNQHPQAKTSLASTLTTCVVTAIIYPIDTCKSMIMGHKISQYSSSLDVMRNLGIRRLYKGVSVGLLRGLPHFWITTLLYENLKKFA